MLPYFLSWYRLPTCFVCYLTTDINGEQQLFLVGNTGGEFKHTLTTTELPEVTLKYDKFTGNPTGDNAVTQIDGNGVMRYSNETEIKFGAGGAHENMQPYLTVAVWLRTG